MELTSGDTRIDWHLSERHLSGTVSEVAREIDELVIALLAVKRSLQPGPANPPRRLLPRLAWPRRFGRFALVLWLLLLASPAAAQSTSPAQMPGGVWRHVLFGVTLESYYQYNANAPDGPVAALRAYDAQSNQFGLQQVAAIVELPPAPDLGRRFGARVDLQFGQATGAVQGNLANEPRPEVYRHVWQAFGSYVIPVGRGLRVDAGKFASNLGYESNYAKDDQAFSRAFLYAFLPFHHAGLRATYPVNERLSLMSTVVNGAQQTEDFNRFTSVQVSATARPATRVSWTASYYRGREQPDNGRAGGPDGRLEIVDAYLSASMGPRLSIAVDVNRTSSRTWARDPEVTLVGVAGYASVTLSDSMSLGCRYERLDDEGLFAGVSQLLQEMTLTLEHRLGDGFLVRGEYRRDWSNRDAFPSSAGARQSQPTVLVGGVWWFGNKDGAW